MPDSTCDRLLHAAPQARSTRALLACGAVAGPLFVAVIAIQELTRDGFDAGRHPISVLSLGTNGWIQIVNFAVAGLLSLAFAAGMRRVLGSGRDGTWGPVLICGYGLGLLIAGLFVADPGLGFPPGTPDGIRALSWHGLVHDLGPPAAFGSLIMVCGLFAHRFAGLQRWGWAGYCGATAIAALALLAWPDGGATVRMMVAVILISAWTTAIAADLMTEFAGCTTIQERAA